MNRYLKLVRYELFRFRKIYYSLFLITLLMQFAGLYFYSRSRFFITFRMMSCSTSSL